MTRFAVILSGGVGERFWPASTPERPKQLLPLVGRRTMLRETVERLSPLFHSRHILVVTSQSLAEAVVRECPELPAENVIAEPRPRNTAAAVGVAACAALARAGAGASVALLPADHVVRDPAGFRFALERAFAVAESDPRIVTLGIRPDRPETGYGYITLGEPLGGGVFRIAAFHEKPGAGEAARLVAEGRSVWNAGVFVACARTLLDEIGRHVPELGALLARLEAADQPRAGGAGGDASRVLYERAPSISFDEAVMERTEGGVVLPVDVGWDDVGSWEAMTRLLEHDAAGNAIRGAARVAEGRDNILFADEGRITVIGASNLLVVRSGAEVLVCARERLREIKDLLRSLNGAAPQGARAAPPAGPGRDSCDDRPRQEATFSFGEDAAGVPAPDGPAEVPRRAGEAAP